MQRESTSAFLERLASRTPAPGGGAAAAVQAGLAAALVGMVARHSRNTPGGPDEADVDALIAAADDCRARALDLAAHDEAAFTAVGEAHRLPKDTPAQQQERTAAIEHALVAAAEPPADVIVLASDVVDLAERLLPFARPSALADLAAGAQAARSAATTSQLNVEANLEGITKGMIPEHLRSRMGDVDETRARVDALVAAVRERLTS